MDIKSLKKIKTGNVIWPTLLGIGAVVFLLWRQFDPRAFNEVTFTAHSVFWLTVAFFFMLFRDVGYILRIRVLTENKLTWLQAIRVIFLWEFTSAITPSTIGGTSVALIYIHKEGISVGKSTAVVLATSFLDEVYFILMFPLCLIFIDVDKLFAIGGGFNFSNAFLLFALAGYSVKVAYVLLVSYGLFIHPQGLKWLISGIFRLPFIRRWRNDAIQAGDDIVESSNELKKKSVVFWLKAFGATVFSWTSRYWVVNALFLAFFAVGDHILLFARQLIMWIMMMVSPTPGGAGLTEIIFSEYLSDFLPYGGIAIFMALLWRLVTYYPYLFIGVFIFPRWLKTKFRRKH
jgi:uncharacterized membrane protein YbhN (UPF0104 family)